MPRLLVSLLLLQLRQLLFVHSCLIVVAAMTISFSVIGLICVLTLSGHLLVSTVDMIAVIAHTEGIVLLVDMLTVGNGLSGSSSFGFLSDINILSWERLCKWTFERQVCLKTIKIVLAYYGFQILMFSRNRDALCLFILIILLTIVNEGFHIISMHIGHSFLQVSLSYRFNVDFKVKFYFVLRLLRSEFRRAVIICLHFFLIYFNN